MDEARRSPYLPCVMRLLLALLALISGVSAPQVALANSPAEVAGHVLGAAESAEAEQAIVLQAVPRRSQAALRKVRNVGLAPAFRVPSGSGFALSDRARE